MGLLMPSRSRRGSRRTTRWVRFLPATNALVDGTSESVSMLTTSDTIVGSTILRIVGNINVHGTTVDVAQQYACGILVAPNSMDSIDMDPAVITSLDWLYWNRLGTNNPAYDGVDSFVGVRWWIDIRGRRKISEGDTVWYNEVLTGSGGNSYVNLSMLVLNP